ncbi:MAG: LysR family transcriptional regulator [Anaerolineaceae bacterium]|nr:MAG: LysR family transcriptional regulator [Anaerolineaceae bacterium]
MEYKKRKGFIMTINQISYFVTAVEYDTFMEAADSLHISQSSLSKSLQRLEDELNIQLFDRTKRSASITKEGKVFYEGALKILDTYNQTISNLAQTVSKLKGSIHLATLPILPAYNLMRPLRSFASQNYDINLIIDEMEDTRINQELANGTCDIAITRKECLDADICDYYTLDTDEMILITSLNHPLAHRESASISELSNEAFILMNKHISIHTMCIDVCKKYNFMPNVTRTARIESILSAVAANEGISLLMRKDLDMFNYKDISLIPLKEEITSTVVLAVAKNKKVSKNVASLIKYLTS